MKVLLLKFTVCVPKDLVSDESKTEVDSVARKNSHTRTKIYTHAPKNSRKLLPGTSVY